MTHGDDFLAVFQEIATVLAEDHNVVLQRLDKLLLGSLWRNPGLNYRQIVNKFCQEYNLKVTEGHLRNKAYRLWGELALVVEEEIDKSNVVDELQKWYEHRKLLNTSNLVGRIAVLESCIHYLRNNHYQVVCITGMPGIGKSDLVRAAVGQVTNRVNSGLPIPTICWCEAEDVQTVHALLSKVSRRIPGSGQQPGNFDNPVDALIDLLHYHSLLLVIDNADTLYDTTCLSGKFWQDNNYESFLRQVVQDPTLQGRVVWVSRVMPWCLEAFRNTLGRLKVEPLTDDDAVSLLKNQNIDTENAAAIDLLRFCAGNPGLLQAAATKIQDSFGGEIQQFLDNPLQGHIPEDERWFKVINTLSMIERQLAIWLMLCPSAHEEVSQLKIFGLSGQHCTDALRSLRRRGLVEPDTQGYYQLHPPYLRYALASWVTQKISQKILAPDKDISELRYYPLTLPTAPAFHRKWHQQYILKPLNDAIKKYHWSQPARQELFAHLLQLLRATFAASNQQYAEGCYGLGNLLSLAMASNTPLQGLDLEGCIVRCADLQNADLRAVCLTNCLFEQTVLPISLQAPLCADLSIDGGAIAIGDAAGRVGYWVKAAGTFTLERYYRFKTIDDKPNPIHAITLDHDTLLISVGQEIYRWWIEYDERPVAQTSVDAEVKQLAQCGDFLAIGFKDGTVSFFDRQTTHLYSYKTSNGPVSCLAFSPTGETVLSVGSGNRLFLWNLIDAPIPSLQEEMPTQGRFLQAVSWHQSRILQAGVIYDNHDNAYPSINDGEGTWRDTTTLTGVIKLTFSRSGAHLVGCNSRGEVYLWQYPFNDDAQPVLSLESLPQKMVVSNDGQRLLVVCAVERSTTSATVQLWHINTRRLIWEMQASCPPAHGIQLDNVTGLTTATIEHLTEFESNT